MNVTDLESYGICVLDLSNQVGFLAQCCFNGGDEDDMSMALGCVLDSLEATASTMEVALPHAIRVKMKLNAKKYPIELCKGKKEKYTLYSATTGITKNQGQSTLHATLNTPMTLKQQELPFQQAIPQLTQEIHSFGVERDWYRFYTPRNLVLALAGELGELAELLVSPRHQEDVGNQLSLHQFDKLHQELADVAIYLLRLAEVLKIDLVALALKRHFRSNVLAFCSDTTLPLQVLPIHLPSLTHCQFRQCLFALLVFCGQLHHHQHSPSNTQTIMMLSHIQDITNALLGVAVDLPAPVQTNPPVTIVEGKLQIIRTVGALCEIPQWAGDTDAIVMQLPQKELLSLKAAVQRLRQSLLVE